MEKLLTQLMRWHHGDPSNIVAIKHTPSFPAEASSLSLKITFAPPRS